MCSIDNNYRKSNKKDSKAEDSLVSVIVPVYNVEPYLKRCLNSLVEQSYSKLEIILVDDGSDDGSGQICDDYKAIDERVIVIHKENGGLADARNVGIDAAEGVYITFVDSDDWISPYYVENLVSALQKTNSDLAISMFVMVDDKEILERRTSDFINIRTYSNEQALKLMLLQQGIETSAPGKLYKKSAVGSLRFPKGKLYEDIMFTTIMMSTASSVVVIDNIDYFYYQREGSILYKSFSEKKMDCIYNSQQLLDYISTNHTELKKDALCWYFSGLCNILFQIPEGEFEHERKYILSEIRRYRNVVISNKNARIKNRGAAILSYLGERPLRTIYKKTQIRGKLLQHE